MIIAAAGTTIELSAVGYSIVIICVCYAFFMGMVDAVDSFVSHDFGA